MCMLHFKCVPNTYIKQCIQKVRMYLWYVDTDIELAHL
jgi:hypothetical protein